MNIEEEILKILKNQKAATISALMNRLGLSQISVERALRSLQRKGLAERAPNWIGWRAAKDGKNV